MVYIINLDIKGVKIWSGFRISKENVLFLINNLLTK